MLHLFGTEIDIVSIVAYTAVILNVAVYSMRTMIPLRMLAMSVNSLFIVYSALAHVYPTLILNCVLLPLNAYRLHEMLQLTRRVKAASEAGFDFNWLRPFTSQRKIAPGEVMFHKGDVADALYLILSGKFVLKETGLVIAPGTVVGEMGLVSPGGLRTQTLLSESGGEILSVTYDHFRQIYFQNPKFGFYFLKLITHRLFENNRGLEKELAECRGSAAAQA